MCSSFFKFKPIDTKKLINDILILIKDMLNVLNDVFKCEFLDLLIAQVTPEVSKCELLSSIK